MRKARDARRRMGLDSVKGYADGGPVSDSAVPQRDSVVFDKNDQTPARTKVPNVYRGKLQPENALPEVYDRKRPVRT